MYQKRYHYYDNGINNNYNNNDNLQSIHSNIIVLGYSVIETVS